MAVSCTTLVSKWTGFALSIFGAVLAYWNFSFNAVAIPLKQTFNYTQSEVEVVSSMGWSGMGLLLSEPLIRDRFGCQVCYVIGSVMSSASAGLFYIAASNAEFFHHWPGLIGLFQLTATTGPLLVVFEIVNVGLSIFSKRNTGKIVGLYTASGASGKIFYAGLIELFFPDDLKGLFFALLIMWSLVFPACALLHRMRPHTPADQTEERDPESRSLINQTDEFSGDSYSIKDMLRCPQFHLTFWSFAFFQGTVLCLMNNITSIGQSVGVENSASLVYEMAVMIILSRLVFGFAFDKINSLVGKFVLMFSSTLSFLVGMVLGVLWLDRTTVYVVTALGGVGMASAFTVPAALLMLRFGSKHYALFSSSSGVCAFVFLTIFQTLIGLFYDRQITEEDSDIFCYGSKCFFLTLNILCGATVVTLLLQILNCCLWIKTPLAHVGSVK